MDKETLSNYGWIVICVMVLAVMLAFASPFGNFIAGAIKSTTQGLFDTNQNALDSAGIEIMQQEFEEMLNGPSATDSPVKFGQPYQMTMEENGMPLTVEYVFYPDGSATMWMADAMGGYLPAGSVTYTETEVILEGDPIKISEDGTYLYDPEDETLRLTVKSVSKGSPKTNTPYTADPNGLIGITGLDVQIGSDGSITVYQNGVAGETIPASAITWYENHFVFNDDGEETTGAIYPDGSKISIGEIVCTTNACKHTSTSLINTTIGTCDEYGYTGDTVCNDCGRIISKGSYVSSHKDENRDDYCDICSSSLNVGLFDATDNLVACWDTLTNKYGLNIEKDYDYNSSRSDASHIRNILSNNTELKSGVKLVIPEGVTQIGTYALGEHSQLTSVITPKTMTKIRSLAFAWNNALENVYISSGITEIANDAFYYCYGRNTITVEAGNPKYYSVNNCVIEDATDTLVIGTNLSIIPTDNTVTTIGPAAFFACGDMKTITIPSNIKEIKGHAFHLCTNLKEVNFNNGLESISGYAFYRTAVEKVHLPKTVKIFSGDVFEDCEYIKEVSVENGNPIFFVSGNCLINQNTKTLVLGTNNSTIPSDGSVTTIGQDSFSGREIYTLVIPDTITKIDAYAFEYTDVDSFVIPSSVKTIGNCMFYSSGIEHLVIEEGLEIIGSQMFSWSKITTITIPKSVKTIDKMAFQNCGYLTDINYNGTKADWKAITFNQNWNDGTGNYTIHCSDGDLTKS